MGTMTFCLERKLGFGFPGRACSADRKYLLEGIGAVGMTGESIRNWCSRKQGPLWNCAKGAGTLKPFLGVAGQRLQGTLNRCSATLKK